MRTGANKAAVVAWLVVLPPIGVQHMGEHSCESFSVRPTHWEESM